MIERWSCEKANQWYDSMPWIRGCNYMNSDCCNRVDQWQEYGFEERFETVREELNLMASVGYNAIRIILQFEVWRDEHDGFMERFERYIAQADKNGIGVMVVFGNDCCVPKRFYKPVKLGKQSVDIGYHGGKKHCQHDGLDEMGYNVIDEPETKEQFFAMVREIVGKYKDDPRIWLWDLYNEPGHNGRDEVSIDNLRRIFEEARSVDPSQPLTSCVWNNIKTASELLPIEKLAIELSDVVSFHSYAPYTDNIEILAHLKSYNRPVFCTEWLHRPFDNRVDEIFPLFFLEKIGCFNWGFVAGLYQTYEPWGSMWADYENGTNTNIDFTKWQHDLFRPSHKPYDPKEIEIIKKFCALADS